MKTVFTNLLGLSVILFRTLVVMSLGTASLSLVACGGIELNLPERYVLASIPGPATSPPETRVSPDGRRWSAPSYPEDANGNPILAKDGVPPGVGAAAELYVLAWFAPNGDLHTQTSTNGLTWQDDRTHGTHNVDANSRPAVTYDYDSDAWFAAFRRADNLIVVKQLRPAPPAVVQVVVGESTSHAPALVYGDHHLILAYKGQGGVVRILRSQDGLSWPSGPGQEVLSNGTPLPSANAPYLTNSQGTLFLSTDGSPPQSSGMLSRVGTGASILIHSSTDGLSWNLERTLTPARSQRGVGVAGPLTEQVVVTSDVVPQFWFNDTPRRRAVPGAKTAGNVSLAHGPKGNGGFVQLTFTFDQTFLRFPGQLGEEEVTLQVEHRSKLDTHNNVAVGSYSPLRQMQPWTFENPSVNLPHFWNEGREAEGFPQLVVPLAQPEESIVIIVDGDFSPSDVYFQFSSLSSLTPGHSEARSVETAPVLFTDFGAGTATLYRYQVGFTVEVSNH